MSKYIDAEKLETIIEERKTQQDQWVERYHDPINQGISNELAEVLKVIESLQQERQTDKQVIFITESHGTANIVWDCRSLNDVVVLLKSAESFISDKQVEALRGLCCGSDYGTVEDRYSILHKSQQDQPTKGYDENYLNEKIAEASKTWENVDVDKYMDEVRGREQEQQKVDLEEAAAMKGLPRWKTIKKDDNAIARIPHVGTNMLGERMLYIGENAISISCLMKLPGFKEEENE